MGAAGSSINGKEIISLDCEMVLGMDKTHDLARVSIVNYHGRLLLDSYVSPTQEVCNYLTHISGIRPSDLIGAPTFSSIQRQVENILYNKIVVGHSLRNDFKVLQLNHPTENIRDIGKSRFIIKKYGNSMGQCVSLRELAEKILNRTIQEGEHDSVEDAIAALDIYKHFQQVIEEEEAEWAQVGRSIEMEPEEESSSIGTGTIVAAGLAAATAIAAVSYLTRNNNPNRRNNN